MELGDRLAALLAERYPSVGWEVFLVRDPLVEPPVGLSELVDAARLRLLEEGWDLAVAITDLPLRLSRRPLLTHSSPTHGTALVSLPALGVRRIPSRLADAIADAVGVLVGDMPARRGANRAGTSRMPIQRRLAELVTDIQDPSAHQGVTFLARVLTGNIRLLLGMIWANRPWRLIGHLSRALIGALAAASSAVILSDVWRIAADADAWRHAVLTLVAVAIAVVTLITAHDLWERAGDTRMREQVALFNLVTLITVMFGIATLYLAVFVVSLGAAALIIDPSLFAHEVGHPVDLGDYMRLAWLSSTFAMVGGALGGTVESDAAVREAAYAYRHEDQTARATRGDLASS